MAGRGREGRWMITDVERPLCARIAECRRRSEGVLRL